MTLQMEDIQTLLPTMVPVGQSDLEDGDVLILAPGFEDRSLAVCSAICVAKGTCAILLDYRPENPENRMGEVREALEKAGLKKDRHSLVTYDRFDPGDFEGRLMNEVARLCSGRALVDISAMSKLAIMLILRTLSKRDVPISILYAEAEIYGPNELEFNAAREQGEIHRPSLQIYTGIHGVVRVDSLASVAMQGQPTAALVFMSFNDTLTQALVNTVYPARLLLINGRPPVHSWREKATAWIHDRVRMEWADDNPLSADGSGLPARSASTLDYRETVILLLELYWRLSASHRILLAPAGSKLQAVACYMVKALHPDIHIEYPSPEGFLRVYSRGIGRLWRLDLDRFNQLIGRISDIESKEFLQIKSAGAFQVGGESEISEGDA